MVPKQREQLEERQVQICMACVHVCCRGRDENRKRKSDSVSLFALLEIAVKYSHKHMVRHG